MKTLGSLLGLNMRTLIPKRLQIISLINKTLNMEKWDWFGIFRVFSKNKNVYLANMVGENAL